VALEAIADEIADTFGIGPNDLALNKVLSEMVECNLLELAKLASPTPAKTKHWYLD